MKPLPLLCFLVLLAGGCKPPHDVYRNEVLNGHFQAREQYFLKSGQMVPLRDQGQFLRTEYNTLRVYQGDSTLVYLPDYKQNQELSSQKDGILVLEANTPEGLKSIRITMGDDYRSTAQSLPFTMGQLIDGPYNAELDTVQTVYDKIDFTLFQ
ncbi:hypothetical protein [Telluribacter humicola]|uniref:hypothetical protein n=1 Tax=Telluribacter humicola TaxID=1720261 RepID=UPI001A97AFA0|nr:hypothetical protein [Telluribacter humicola]